MPLPAFLFIKIRSFSCSLSLSTAIKPPLAQWKVNYHHSMDHQKRNRKKKKSEEVSSIEWVYINMTEQEEDLIYRMYRLVGDRWDLIAGRIPGRKAEEIERYWIMSHGDGFAEKRKQNKRL